MPVPFDSGPPKNPSDCMAVYAELRRQGFDGRSRTVAFCKLGNVRIGEPGRVVHRSHDTGGMRRTDADVRAFSSRLALMRGFE